MVTKTKFDSWLNAVIEAGWLAALITTPLFFNVFSSRVFEPDKISLVRTIALVMLVAWLVKLANGGAAWLPAQASNDSGDGATGSSDPAPQADSTSLLVRALRIPLLIPVLILVVAYLISTVFSVARFVSWWGSYQRLQGTYTFVSYIIIATLTAAHLRQPIQVRRIQHTIVLTSLPIAIYGIIQHYGMDPLPWGGDVTTRVAGNAGNAIFLAAYLIMAVFFTTERVYSSFAHLLSYQADRQAEGHDLYTALAGGAYLFVLMVQLLAIFWTQSRGPWLGLFAGSYVFVLLLFTALRPRRHRLWTMLWVGLGVTGTVVLILVNTTPLFSGLSSIPYVGRLTNLLESGGGTGRVRVVIWQGAAEMVRPHEPLIFPDGSYDATNAIRPLIGYGPEAMWIAYNPFYQPELAHLESRNASPDRSHNETWDSLVITGVLGFIGYLSVFIAIFYWSLHWLRLLINRRDSILFGVLLFVPSAVLPVIFYTNDGDWSFFGVALSAGLILGLAAYITLAAFLHPNQTFSRTEIPRQLVLITILATVIAHFIEIHFGIAIAATRSYFWVEAALMVAVGAGWAVAEPLASIQEESNSSVNAAQTPPQERSRGRRRRGRRGGATASTGSQLSTLPSTLMVDVLIFLTFVFIYTTNSQGLSNPFAVLFSSILQRPEGGGMVSSPALFFLMVFVWVVGSTIGICGQALQQRRLPSGGWWLRAYLFHFLIVWGVWFLYGIIQAQRLVPGAGGGTLDSQLNNVAGHFAVYTWIVVIWLLVTGAFLARSLMRGRRVPLLGNAGLSLGAAVVLSILIAVVISQVNIALVRADIIYKQGQQFDSQGNWISSVELYRRALNARRTEDHYMLFLGRAILEQAKQAPVDGGFKLPESPTLDDVLALTPEAVSQMSRHELLRAAEVILLQAQRVNPLNTDHTANLARLYRTWADLSSDTPEVRQEMLDKSIAQYNMAVQLSPNAAHLWNEKGNAHVARSEPELAEETYRHSLTLDPRYDQTYLLLADFLERQDRPQEVVELLREGVESVGSPGRLYSYLGIALARTNDPEGAIEANHKVLEYSPNDVGAMRNLALLYRDQGDVEQAILWVENSIATVNPNNVGELKTLRQLAAQLYQSNEQDDQVITQYQMLHQLDPNDADIAKTLYGLYVAAENWDGAIQTLQALMTLEPDSYQHPLAMAQILQQLGQPDSALSFANQALALAPEEQKQLISDLIASIAPSG